MKRLIVGLGNPGKSYRSNRHNIGFMALDLYAKHKGVSFSRRSRFNGWLAETTHVCLLKPRTYMNLSGTAVGKVKDFYGIDNEDILVIHDDLDLPFMQFRLREKGGTGGHKGIRSVIDHIGDDFRRFRIGIGRDDRLDVKDYVLSDLSKSEKETFSERGDDIIGLLDDFVDGESFSNIMNAYNQKASD